MTDQPQKRRPVPAKTGWQAKPGWTLVEWMIDYWTGEPLRPTDDAELCGDGVWASVFVDHRVVATWFFSSPISQSEGHLQAPS